MPFISVHICTMLVRITKNTFEPGGKKTPSIYLKGEVKDLTDEAADELIEKGAAEEVKPEKPAKPEKSATPDDTWTVPELKRYAEEKKIDLTSATKKDEILTAITAAQA